MTSIFKGSTFYKYLISFVIFGFLIVALTNALNYYHLNHISKGIIKDQIDFQFDRVGNATRTLIGSAELTVVNAAQSDFIDSYLITKSPDAKENLQRYLLGLARANAGIFQLRLLDVNGNEVIDVYKPNSANSANSAYRIEKPEQLQDKSDSRYFAELQTLSDDTTYYSSINLNKEFGEIERPLRPTLRIARPVISPVTGNRAGYIIANMNASYLLSILVNSEKLDITITDKDGFILKSTNSEYDFSRYLNKSPTVQTDIALLREQLLYSDGSVFQYDLDNLIKNDSGLVLYARASQNFISRLTAEALEGAVQSIIAILLLAFPVAFLIAKSLSKTANALQENIEENKKYSSIIDQYIPILETNKEGIIVGCNDAMSVLSGYRRRDVIGAPASIFQHDACVPADFTQLWTNLKNGISWKGEFHNKTAQGEEFWLQTHIMPNKNDAGRVIGYISIGADITDKKLLERRSEVDSMTGLFNRLKGNSVLEQQLENASYTGKSFGVIILDVDHFKQVNDTYGHLEGDLVLKEVANILKYNVRSTDHVVRWGGEEFLVICPSSDLTGCVKVAEKLRVQVESFPFEGQATGITVSAGVAVFTGASTINALLANADSCLYQAKEQGRNRVVSALSKYTAETQTPAKHMQKSSQ